MSANPEVIISGFADEGPVDKKAESQLTMLAALGMSYYCIRFVDAGGGVKNVMQLTKTSASVFPPWARPSARSSSTTSRTGRPMPTCRSIDT